MLSIEMLYGTGVLRSTSATLLDKTAELATQL